MLDKHYQSNKSDEELMMAIQGGCNESFEILYVRHKTAIYNYCIKILKNKQSAEDCVQAAFIKLYEKASHFKSTSKFMPWFYVLTKHIISGHLRRSKIRQAISLEADISSNDFDSATKLKDMIASKEPSPAAAAENNELLKILEQALLKLPETDREIILLCDIEKMNHDEVAKIINCPVDAVRVKAFRARVKLAKLCGLDEKFFGDPK